MDREKVIKGLECHEKGARGCQHDCPYGNEYSCQIVLCHDALAMLKEQDELLHKKQCDINKLCLEVSEWKHKYHDTSKEQETMMQCIKGKCRICIHCANCDVDENGLLKEQEAVKPVLDEQTGRIWLCGKCGSYVGFHDPNEFDKYCRDCGTPVLWEGR